MSAYPPSDRFDARRASWGSIFGGVFTVLSVSILLSLLATALGFGVIDPLSDQPFEGVGTAFGIGSAVALLIALALGGFVAGRLAGRSGFAHGFLVWSTSLLLAAVLSSMAIGSAARMAGGAISSVFSAAGSVVSTAGSAAASAGSGIASGIGTLAERIGEELDIDIDTSDIDGEQVERQVADVLRDTGADSLQPEYLEQQLEGARADVRRAVRRLTSSPTDFDRITSDLTSSLQERVEAIGQDADRDAVINALAENTDMSRSEAEELTDRLVVRFEQARETANERLSDLQDSIDDARVQLAEYEQRAREQAAVATDAIARSALWAFVALLIGALAAGGAGLLGSRSRFREEDVVDTRVTARPVTSTRTTGVPPTGSTTL